MHVSVEAEANSCLIRKTDAPGHTRTPNTPFPPQQAFLNSPGQGSGSFWGLCWCSNLGRCSNWFGVCRSLGVIGGNRVTGGNSCRYPPTRNCIFPWSGPFPTCAIVCPPPVPGSLGVGGCLESGWVDWGRWPGGGGFHSDFFAKGRTVKFLVGLQLIWAGFWVDVGRPPFPGVVGGWVWARDT